jgi:hypothetical protein
MGMMGWDGMRWDGMTWYDMIDANSSKMISTLAPVNEEQF